MCYAFRRTARYPGRLVDGPLAATPALPYATRSDDSRAGPAPSLMRRRSDRHHLKRRMRCSANPAMIQALRKRARYGGNPEHKRDPGDFGLEPPASPRPDKTLCDTVGVFHRAEALAILREGIDVRW